MGRYPSVDGRHGLTDRSSGSNVPPIEAVPQWSWTLVTWEVLEWDVGPISLDGSSVLCLPLDWKFETIPSGT